jgi:hypothetical protein
MAFIARARRRDTRLQCFGTATDAGLRAQGHRRRTAGQAWRWYGAKGTDSLRLEAVGPSPHRRRDGEVLCTRRVAQGQAGRAPGALKRRPSCISAGQPYFDVRFSKNLNYTTKTVDTKVVEETSLCNIYKGRPMFFSTV